MAGLEPRARQAQAAPLVKRGFSSARPPFFFPAPVPHSRVIAIRREADTREAVSVWIVLAAFACSFRLCWLIVTYGE
jgi:hypothetical protein